MAFIYTYQNMIDSSEALAHGGTSNTKKLRELANRAVREVFARVDLRSAKRRAQMSPALFERTYQYTKPSDMKGLGIIDLKPQIDRANGFRGEWQLTTPENFDQVKRTYRNVIAVQDHDSIGRLLVSAVLDSKRATIHQFDSLTSNGTVDADSDNSAANNQTIDKNNFVQGNGSVNFDIDTSGAVAEVVVPDMTAVDLTDYEGQPLFLWVFIPSGSQGSVSNIALHWGDDSDGHYIRSVTTTNEGLAFQAGWNLLRFDWDDNVTTDGVPTITSVNFAKIIITLSAALGSQVTNWRIDFLVAKRGVEHDVFYYTKFGWTNSGGTYIENSTAVTDLLVADTDEFDLILSRFNWLLARANREPQREVNEAKTAYVDAEENYKVAYPSEAMVITESYYEHPSLGNDRIAGDVFDKDTT